MAEQLTWRVVIFGPLWLVWNFLHFLCFFLPFALSAFLLRGLWDATGIRSPAQGPVDYTPIVVDEATQEAAGVLRRVDN